MLKNLRAYFHSPFKSALLVRCQHPLSVVLLFFLTTCTTLSAQELPNQIIVCDNGLEMLTWDLQFIHEAKSSIEVIPCFFGGKTACDLLDAIEKRLGEVPTLQVHILASPVLMKDKEWSQIRRLQSNYPMQFHFELTIQIPAMQPDLISIDNHVKLCIVDELYFSAGGTNLEEKHCTEGTYTPDRDKENEQEVDTLLAAGVRDQDIVGKGPVAQDLRKSFFQLFSVWENYNQTQLLTADPASFKDKHYFPVTEKGSSEKFDSSERIRLLDKAEIRCIFGGPHQIDNAITREYIRLIQEAKEEIFIAQLYFFPIEPLFQALIDAVNRGVKLTVITNGITEISAESAKLFGWGNRLSYLPMFYGGTYHFWDAAYVAQLPVKNTEIYEYNVRDMLLHKKIMLVDKSIFVLGSYNMGTKSAYGDYELILVLNSKAVVQDVLKVLDKDLQYSNKITPQQAFEWYFDPFIAYLGSLQRKLGGFL